MIQLPENQFFNGFYMWFDREKKEESYGTPLYLYNTLREDNFVERHQKLILEKDTLKVRPSKKKAILKHPRFFVYQLFGKDWINAN